MKKKILSLFLATSMILSLFPIISRASETSGKVLVSAYADTDGDGVGDNGDATHFFWMTEEVGNTSQFACGTNSWNARALDTSSTNTYPEGATSGNAFVGTGTISTTGVVIGTEPQLGEGNAHYLTSVEFYLLSNALSLTGGNIAIQASADMQTWTDVDFEVTTLGTVKFQSRMLYKINIDDLYGVKYIKVLRGTTNAYPQMGAFGYSWQTAEPTRPTNGTSGHIDVKATADGRQAYDLADSGLSVLGSWPFVSDNVGGREVCCGGGPTVISTVAGISQDITSSKAITIGTMPQLGVEGEIKSVSFYAGGIAPSAVKAYKSMTNSLDAADWTEITLTKTLNNLHSNHFFDKYEAEGIEDAKYIRIVATAGSQKVGAFSYDWEYVPVVTEAPTQTPVVTEAPTETPAVTEAPTQTPVVTEAPTQTPVVTQAPTQAPDDGVEVTTVTYQGTDTERPYNIADSVDNVQAIIDTFDNYTAGVKEYSIPEFVGIKGGANDSILIGSSDKYISAISFYGYVAPNTFSEDTMFKVSVSRTKDGEYKYIQPELIAKGHVLGKANNHLVHEYRYTELRKIRYIRIEFPADSSCYPKMGSFSYNWSTEPIYVPIEGTKIVRATINPIWMADTASGILSNFVASSGVSENPISAGKELTQATIDSKRDSLDIPVEVGDTAYVGVVGNDENSYVVIGNNGYDLKGLRFHAYQLGGAVTDSNTQFRVYTSLTLDGEYTEVYPSRTRAGVLYVRGNNHYIDYYSIENLTNTKFIKIQFCPKHGGGNKGRIGGFEYDWYDSNALIEDQIEEYANILREDFITYNELLGEQNKLHIESDIDLPTEYTAGDNTFNIQWSSSDACISSDGNVTQGVVAKDVVLTARVYKEGIEKAVYSKSYDVTVAPVSSQLILWEDFEAVTEPTNVSGYNGWTTSIPPNETVTSKIDIDHAGDRNNFAGSNKAAILNRENEGQADNNVKNIPEKITKGKVEISFKHMVDNVDNESRVSLAGVDGYIRNGSVYGYVSSASLPNIQITRWVGKEWHKYRFIVDLDNSMMDVYYDDVKQTSEPVMLPASKYEVSTFSFKTKRQRAGYGDAYFDDLVIRKLTPDTNGEILEADKNILDIPEEILSDIDLPATGNFGSAVLWTSSNPEVISEGGIVNRGEVDETVTLTATLTRGGLTDTREFEVLVPAADGSADCTQAVLEKIADRYSFSRNVTSQPRMSLKDSFTLPETYSDGDAGRCGGVNIAWETDSDAIANDGTITRTEHEVHVNLKATFSFAEAPEISVERVYPVVVAGSGDVHTLIDFDDLSKAGESVTEIGFVREHNDSEILSYKLARDNQDYENGMMLINRSDKGGDNDAVTYSVGFTGRTATFSTDFLIKKANDRIDIALGGINGNITVYGDYITALGEKFEIPVSVNVWHRLSIEFDDYNKYYNVYLDGVRLNTATLIYKGELSIDTVKVDSSASGASMGVVYIDNIEILDTEVSNEYAVAQTIAELSIPDTVEWDIALPELGKYGAKISWTSSDTQKLEADGTVHRTVGSDSNVVMTARVERDGYSDTHPFTVTVKGLTGQEIPTQEKFEEHVAGISFEMLSDEKITDVTKNLEMISEYSEGNSAFYGGMDITWETEYPGVISEAGEVVRYGLDRSVTLKAICQSKREPSIKFEKKFNVIVKANSEVIYLEDFESVTEEGTQIHEFKLGWTVEQQNEEFRGQNSVVSKDPSDIKKSFADANKCMKIERYRVATGSEVLTERINLNFKPFNLDLTGDAIAVSLDIRMKNLSSRFDWTLRDAGIENLVYFNNIQGSVKGNFTEGGLADGQWHNLCIVICPDAGVQYYLLDGHLATAEMNYEYNYKYGMSGLRFDTFRKSGLSEFYIDNITVRRLDINNDDLKAVTESYDALTIAETATDHIELPTKTAERATIKWSSSNEAIVGNDGTVYASGVVTMKAQIKRGDAMLTKDFTVNVTKSGATEFVVGNIVPSGNSLSSVALTTVGNTTDAELIVEVYDQGRLVDMRSSAITSENVSFTPVNLEGRYTCEIKAYVKRNSTIISNIVNVHV